MDVAYSETISLKYSGSSMKPGVSSSRKRGRPPSLPTSQKVSMQPLPYIKWQPSSPFIRHLTSSYSINQLHNDLFILIDLH